MSPVMPTTRLWVDGEWLDGDVIDDGSESGYFEVSVERALRDRAAMKLQRWKRERRERDDQARREAASESAEMTLQLWSPLWAKGTMWSSPSSRATV